MADTDREYPELPELAALKKSDLLDWATKLGVEGRSSMTRDELESALTDLGVARRVEESLEDSPTIPARLEAVEARMSALEGRLQALDDRTIGSTLPMGS